MPPVGRFAQPSGDFLSRPSQTKPPHQAQPADIDVGDVEIAVDPGQLQVVDPHDTHPVGVDDLLVEHVARQKQVAFYGDVGPDIRPSHLQGDGRSDEHGHIGNWHQQGIVRPPLHGEGDDDRMNLSARRDHQVVQATHPFTVKIGDGFSDQLAHEGHRLSLLRDGRRSARRLVRLGVRDSVA